jgi:cell division protein FtsZ
MTNDILKFELPKDQSSIIKVFGVGGGGCNAVKHMYEQGIKGVDFIVCNTDAQSLETNPVPYKIQIGKKGLGAGSVPSVGKEAAMEDIEKLKEALATNTEMVFITAGMGGGTGTGAAPVLAELAREMGILTVGIVTLPFGFEGRKRRGYADEGINDLKEHVDALLVICNDKLRELYGNLKVTEAFSKADNILTTAAKSIAEIITNEGSINVDLEDVKTVMRESGVAIMGSGRASGEDRARKAVEEALSSPLLNDSNITGAKNILLYLAYGADEHAELSMDEITEITDFVNDEAGAEANVIWGHGIDDSLGSDISVTIIATGFKALEDLTLTSSNNKNTIVHPLKMSVPEKEIIQAPANGSLTNIEMVQRVNEDIAPDYDFTNTSTAPVNTATIVHNLFDEPTVTQTTSVENELTPMLKTSVDYASESVQEKINPIEIPMDDYQEATTSVNATRIDVMRKYSNMIRTEEGLSAIENVPAYMRKGIQLNDPISSSEMQSSALSISQTSDNQTVIDRKNKYLFDNVD